MSATQGFSVRDIDSSQISPPLMDIAEKKVNAYKSPISVCMSLSLADNTNKVIAVQRLLSELDKRNLFGKLDVEFTGTRFSSEEIEKITKMMENYKDKPINFSFDTKVNNFSREDTANILSAVNGSKSTLYPFSSMTNDGLTPDLRQSFLKNNPNIIDTPNDKSNYWKLRDILGFSSNDIRGELVNRANEKRISASEYARSLISAMDQSKLEELSKYSSALERLSINYGALTLGNLQKNGYDDENEFYKSIKQAMEAKLQAHEQSNSNNHQTQSYTSNDQEKQSANKDDDKGKLDEKLENHINNNTGTAEELWNLANQIDKENKLAHNDDFSRVKIVAYEVVERDPTFKPQIMFNTIATSANEGYANEKDPADEIAMYSADAKALRSLAEHNPDIASSSRLLSTLNEISKNTIACYQEGKATDKEASKWFSVFASEIISAYAQCDYDTPQKAETALKNIAEITKNSDKTERNSSDVIKAVHAIVNYSETNKDSATAAFRSVHLISPQNSEEASKLLSVYKNISLDNPELAEASADKMFKIFRDFPHDEKLQKECLSTLGSLNGFRSRFDEETQQKFDLYTRSMKCRIDAEELKRRKGEETTWKAPSPERRPTNTQSYSNVGNTYTGR